MTDKQLTGLRTTLTGAALFIGGALIPEPNGGLGMLSMLAGLILMLAEAEGKVFWHWFKTLGDEIPQKKESEEQTNDPN